MHSRLKFKLFFQGISNASNQTSKRGIHTYHSGSWTENYKKNLGEYKVITQKQFLGIIFFFYVFNLAVALAFLCENAVEAV